MHLIFKCLTKGDICAAEFPLKSLLSMKYESHDMPSSHQTSSYSLQCQTQIFKKASPVPGCLLSEFELKEIGILKWLRMDQELSWNGAWEHQMENELIVSELNYDLDQLSIASSSRVDPGQWSANILKCCIQERLDKWNL